MIAIYQGEEESRGRNRLKSKRRPSGAKACAHFQRLDGTTQVVPFPTNLLRGIEPGEPPVKGGRNCELSFGGRALSIAPEHTIDVPNWIVRGLNQESKTGILRDARCGTTAKILSRRNLGSGADGGWL